MNNYVDPYEGFIYVYLVKNDQDTSFKGKNESCEDINETSNSKKNS